MTVIICDDDEIVCCSLEKQIKFISQDIEVVKLNRCGEVYEYMKNRKESADAVFMDIEFSECNGEGIRYAAELLTDFPELKVIFFTGYSEKYIEEIFTGLPKNNPFGIIKKPVSISVLDEYIKRIKNGADDKGYIRFKDIEKGFVNIECRNIMFVSSFKRTVSIMCSGENEYIGYSKLSEIFESLKSISPDFYYCHKSYVINMKKVTCIPADDKALFINDHRIPLSSINGTTAAAKKKFIIKYNS